VDETSGAVARNASDIDAKLETFSSESTGAKWNQNKK
jgi:hypothetical protein